MPCPHCPLSFSRASVLLSHVRRAHPAVDLAAEAGRLGDELAAELSRVHEILDDTEDTHALEIADFLAGHP